MLTIYSVTKNQNLTPDVTTVLFDLQVVILAGILYQWSTHTVMGTEIGVNPHTNCFYVTSINVDGTIDLFDLQVVH